jgi:uncharacterized protein (DUF4415 family)
MTECPKEHSLVGSVHRMRIVTEKTIPNAKEVVSLRIDRDILDHFQEAGPGWQGRINEALRKVVGK